MMRWHGKKGKLRGFADLGLEEGRGVLNWLSECEDRGLCDSW